jgi:diguanylate cyclase (GGDEF)-like protein
MPSGKPGSSAQSPSRQLLQLEALLPFIERMTHGRERPQLEHALVEALVHTLGVDTLRLYKYQHSSAETLVWLAIEHSPEGLVINDDGINTPEQAQNIDELPLVKTYIQTGLPDFADPRLLLPILMDSGRWFGFVEVGGSLVHVEQMQVAGEVIAIFKNMMALLEYSEVDKLTGLLNRKTFDDYLLRILSSIGPADNSNHAANLPKRRRQISDDHHHWLGVIDIDHFKRINDTYGHSIGDEVLIMLAALMKDMFRTNDKLFRFGGEEFVVLLKPALAADAHAAFERFRSALESREFPLVGRVTASIGYAPISSTDLRTQIIDRADQALYWAKEHGRNQVANYDTLIASGALQHQAASGSVELY